MWFNEKNAIKKLARNLHKGRKKINVITIETVKRYGSTYYQKRKNMKSYVLHFMFCERVETCLQSLEHMYVHYYKNVCYVDVYFMNNTNYGHCSTGFSLEEP